MADPTDRDLGYAEGALTQRLAQYDRHFAAINGSVERTAAELVLLRRSLDGLAEAQRAANTVAEAVAQALEKREEKVDAQHLSNRGVVAWAAGLIAVSFAVAATIKAWLGVP